MPPAYDQEAATDPRDVLELLAASSADTDNSGEGGLVHLTRLPAREGRTADIPDDLPALLRQRLELAGIDRLWEHQVAVLDAARGGRHTIVSTGTASGKTLAYLLGVLERIVADERATALYLAPTKALAHDQLRAVRDLKLAQIRAASIDGDTPGPERDAIRATANLLLTNPDLVHHSILGDHRRWADFLHRLAFVVVDEAHTARGVFGSHLALVLRRLRRLAERYGAEPTWLLASATIGNPAEHASRLTGLDVTAVTDDTSTRGPFDIGLWQPPRDDDGRATSTLRVAGELLSSFVAAGIQTLVFARSRKAAEVIAIHARDRLGDASDDAGALAERVAAYRAGYLADERRELERRLRDGELRGVAATEALELGIDVSGLDAVVLAGWPGTTASFWQRIGRAGRAGGPAAAVLVADDDPLDQYIVGHPDRLLTHPPEDATIDPSNPYLLAAHLRCACHEAPPDVEEATRWFGGGAAELLEGDVADGTLRLRGGRHYWTSRRRPAGLVDLRAASSRTIRVVDADTGAVIGDVDEPRAHRQVHTGAIHLHQGRQLRIERLDLDEAVALATDAPDTSLTTRARVDTDVDVLEVTSRRALGADGMAACFGRLRVTSQVTGYDVLRISSDEVLDRVELDLPAIELDTRGVWWIIPAALLDDAGVGSRRAPGSLHAAEHAAIGIMPLIALCDRWDIGGMSTVDHPATGTPTVFVYDGHPGGAGLAERSFARLGEHLRLTRTTVADCRCDDGCPSCVQSPKCGNGNDPLDKHGAVILLDVVLERLPADGAR